MTVETLDGSNPESTLSKAGYAVIVVFLNEAKASSQNMLVALEALSKDQGSKLKVFKKTFEPNGSLETANDVASAPTTVFFKAGKKVDELIGYYQYVEAGPLKNKLERLLTE